MSNDLLKKLQNAQAKVKKRLKHTLNKITRDLSLRNRR